jgi:ATP-dependent Clp protease ATP-binding subunit ClpA
MLSSVLGSERAIAVNIQIMRAFVQLRGLLASNKELARRFDQLEARLDKKLASHDEAIAAILSAIRQLMNPPVPKRRPIGFTADLSEKR